MPVAVNSGARLGAAQGGAWRLQGWVFRSVIAGITDRSRGDGDAIPQLAGAATVIEAEQVHGGSVAIVGGSRGSQRIVAGCDALLTGVPGIALLIRTADCLPLFLVDPGRRVVGLVHAGWRGLLAQVPLRVVAACQRMFHSRPAELCVAIGPAIRECCYEVGPEFGARFGRFVRQRGARRTCDLAGVAVDQLLRSGLRAGRVWDSQRCTACERKTWSSVRREGEAAGRMTSFIMLPP